MAENVSDFVWRRLNEWGIKRVFGYPGDGVGGLDVALEHAKDMMHYVQVRHEEMAAFMASAHAKFTGEVGLCYATSGPGAIHLLNGLYDAKMDHVPVVAIVGQQARTAIGAHYQQEVDLQSLFKDVAADFVAMASVPSQVRHLIDRAVRIASSRRTVTCVILPNDLQGIAMRTRHWRMARPIPASAMPARPLLPCGRATCARPREFSTPARRWRCWSGAGALDATDEVIAVAEKLQAGVAKALLGKAALPDDLPFVTGSHRPARHQAELGHDAGLRHAADGRLRVSLQRIPAQAGQRARRADRHRRHACSACATRWKSTWSATAQRRCALCCRCWSRRQDDSWRQGIEKDVADWWKTLEERAMQSGRPDQSAARVLGAVATPARQLHHDRRQRLGRQLVCAATSRCGAA